MKKVLLGTAVLLSANAIAADERFADVVKPLLGKSISVNEGAHSLEGVQVAKVGADYFCISYLLVGDKESHLRCYPFSAIRWMVPDGSRPIVAVSQ